MDELVDRHLKPSGLSVAAVCAIMLAVSALLLAAVGCMPATRSQIEAAAKWGKCENDKLAKRAGEAGPQLMLYELAALAALECAAAPKFGDKAARPDVDVFPGAAMHVNGA